MPITQSAWARSGRVLKSPPITALGTADRDAGGDRQDQQFNGLAPSDANDMAWSEYNHHWAAMVVLVAGLRALLSAVPSRYPRLRWATILAAGVPRPGRIYFAPR